MQSKDSTLVRSLSPLCGFEPIIATPRFLAATQIHSSLLTVSVGAVLMPAAFHYSLSWRTDTTATDQKSAILKMSHGVRCFFLRKRYDEH